MGKMISCVFGMAEASMTEEQHEHIPSCKACQFTCGLELPEPNVTLDLDTIELHARDSSKLIVDNYIKLNDTLKRLEPTVQKRWMKKAMWRRTAMLESVWPQINRSHRPDFALIREFKAEKKSKERKNNKKNKNKNRNRNRNRNPIARKLHAEAYLWPYLNTEDLVQGDTLLTFINSRGRHFPHVFVDLDLQAARRSPHWPDGTDIEEFELEIGNGETPETYAVLSSASEKSRDTVKKRFPPIVGLFVLELQVHITTFANDVVRAILFDYSEEQILAAPYVEMPVQVTSREEPVHTSSLSALALDAPYRVPQDLDVSRIRSLVSTQLSVEADHLWSLQEDPAYFVSELQEWSEHTWEHSISKKKKGKEVAWKTVAAHTVAGGLSMFMMWDTVHQHLAKMDSVQDQFRDGNERTGRLNPVGENFWATTETLLDVLMAIYISHLEVGIVNAPRLRATFQDPHSFSPVRGLSTAATKIHTVFGALFDETQTELYGFHPLIQEAQYMVDTDKDVERYFDGWLLDVLGSLALASEIRNCIHRFEPWRSGWREAGVHDREEVTSTKDEFFNDICQIRRELVNEAQLCFPALGIPTDGRFAYPSDKKRNKETVNRMRASESQLDSVWIYLRHKFTKQIHVDVLKKLEANASEPRELYRTPEWLEKPPTVSEGHNEALSESPLPSLSTQSWQQGATLQKENHKREVELASDKAKAKIKSRPDIGAAVPEVAGAEGGAEDPPEVEEEPPRPPMSVTPRVYNVLVAMLPTGGGEYVQSQEVAWYELLHAFTFIGLLPEKLYGSVWIFRPTAELRDFAQINKSIQIHEPREVRGGNKISPFMARRYGKRLNRLYDWTAASFTCD